jgi:SAM-dependent methyltransferase
VLLWFAQVQLPWCYDLVTREAANGDTGAQLSGYDPVAYGDELGADYDVLYPGDGLETDATVAFLAELAECRPERSVLEFGIGTGRLAIDLYRRGLLVAGIDASERMVAALRSKAPDAAIEVALGDFASTRIARSFSVVALVYNNILDERGLPAQLAVFENAARHLAQGGCFVVEAFVLDEVARDGSWTVKPRYVGEEHVELQMSRFDIETSTLERTLVHLRPEGPQFISVKDVYSGPGELDVMAYVNGMTRIARYSSWSRAPFTSRSRRHITVYQLG